MHEVFFFPGIDIRISWHIITCRMDVFCGLVVRCVRVFARGGRGGGVVHMGWWWCLGGCVCVARGRGAKRLETKNTFCPWRPGRRGRAQSLTVRGKSPQRTPLVGSCLPNQGVSSQQGAPLPRRASTEQTVSSPGQLDSARATSSRVAKARP